MPKTQLVRVRNIGVQRVRKLLRSVTVWKRDWRNLREQAMVQYSIDKVRDLDPHVSGFSRYEIAGYLGSAGLLAGGVFLSAWLFPVGLVVGLGSLAVAGAKKRDEGIAALGAVYKQTELEIIAVYLRNQIKEVRVEIVGDKSVLSQFMQTLRDFRTDAERTKSRLESAQNNADTSVSKEDLELAIKNAQSAVEEFQKNLDKLTKFDGALKDLFSRLFAAVDDITNPQSTRALCLKASRLHAIATESTSATDDVIKDSLLDVNNRLLRVASNVHHLVETSGVRIAMGATLTKDGVVDFKGMQSVVDLFVAQMKEIDPAKIPTLTVEEE